jgi:PAS domain S-box-containing protein
MNDLTNCELEPLWEDDEFFNGRVLTPGHSPRLMVWPAREHPSASSLAKIENAFALRGDLDSTWSARPLEIVKFRGRPALLVEEPDGEFLDKMICGPMAMAEFLRLAIGIASALGGLHARGFVHKDIKPANLIVDIATGKAWLTGFGLTSRLPRHRQPPVPPEVIAGSLAYMAPEQTGRMNRSVDSRSDLYSLGVTLYEALTGSPPFAADSPMEWVHCHTAKQPPSPSERLETVPATISAIVMKLLAKTAEERYQSAAGVEADLRRGLSEWEAGGHIGNFAIGEHDSPGRLLIPEKLYGREREVGTLLGAFDRIVAGCGPELVLVSGYSGIGKSAVVNELHKPLVPPRGLFAAGKFDQYKRDIPYATLAQAFRSLIRPLLSKNDEELASWRDAFREALGPNGALVVELVPELLHIVGAQAPVPELAARDAQARFHQVLRQFIKVFARPEHPLALFLDDLQWLDAATLDLLEDLVSRKDLQHLLLIGAYRDNEVHATHPLMRKLEAMRQAGAVLHDIVLAPLGIEDLGQLVADSLRSESKRTTALAGMIHQKTSGNPFFVIQFIATLADEGLLAFDYSAACWSWDLPQIQAKGYTDNIVDLMVEKLSRLPVNTQSALQLFACLGNSAEFTTLEMVHPLEDGDVHEALWEAEGAGLVFRVETSYRFLHDRVQEAAYSLIPKANQAQAHLRIGRLLAERTPSEQREESVFEIVNQLNRGLRLIDSAEERERVAGLNLMAAKRAKISTAYSSALKYLGAGRSLLTDATWGLNYRLIFSIESLTAECELLTAEMAAAEERLTMLSQRAETRHDFAVVTRLQLTLYTTLDRSEVAIDIALKYLRREGTVWPQHPSRDEVMVEYNRIWSLLGDRPIEDLADLPRLVDPDVIDMLDVFTEIVHPAMFYDENLSTLVVCRMVNLSLEYGNCDGSSFGYVWLAMFAGPRFGNYRQGFRFGQLGLELVEARGFSRYQARTYLSFATLTPWARHAAQGRELVRRAFDVAYRMGDLTFTTYSWHALITNYLAVGDRLELVQKEAEVGLEFATKAGFGLVIANCETQLGLIRTLRGLTPIFGRFDDEDYTEAKAEAHYGTNPALVLSECFYWTRKLQARFLSGNYAEAVEYAHRAERILWTAASQVETGDFRFYAALAHAAAWTSAPADEKQQHCDKLREHGNQLEIWAEHCPANFENRAALVQAEIARIEERKIDAELLYEKAIQSAQENGFVHNEAVCHEVAAQFYFERGLKTIADSCLRNARACYFRWGARGKVIQLESHFPHLKAAPVASEASATINSPVSQMDAEIVIKAAQALSSEINLTILVEKLIRLTVEYAGAQRGLLILLHGDVPHIEGEATFEGGDVAISVRHALVEPNDLLQAALQYSLRTRERAVLNDAAADPNYSGDEYVKRRAIRSVLCLPILKHTEIIGALYLENNLTAHAFSAARVAVLDVLSSQAAISLENARLYAALERENQERKQIEGELGLIFDNIPGLVVLLSPSGAVEFENGRTREYLGPALANTGEWATNGIVCPDDIPRVFPIFGAGIASGDPFEYDVRLRHASGIYRWFQLRAYPLRDEAGRLTRWYVLLSDIEDRKQAEVIRASELRLREMINAIPSSVWTSRPDGYCDFFNQRWLDYAGMSEEEAQGWGWLAVIHPDDSQRLTEQWRSCLTAGAPVDMEGRIRRHDGVYRWFLFRGNPLRDESGKILRWFGTNTDIEDRKQAEAIRESEQNLRQIINTIPTMVWSALPDGACDFFNQNWLQYTGFTLEQALGWGWTAAFHPDDLQEAVLAYWQSCLMTGTPVNTELRMRRHDGVYRWFLLLAAPLRDEMGEIRGWYGTNIDLDDRKQAEEQLRRSEEILAEGQRVSSTGSFVWKTNETIVTYSEEAGRIMELEPGEVLTLERLGNRIHPDDLPMLAAKIEDARASGSDQDYEIRFLMPDGRIKFVHSISHAVRDSEGELDYIGTMQDVTSRHLAEEQVRKSELHLRQMTETIPEMLWSATAEGAIDYCNARLLEYTGFAASEVMGSGWTKLLHPGDVEHTAREWLECVATGKQYVVEVRTLHAADGGYRWCITSALPLLDAQGRIAKWYGTVVDVHDRKRADEELRRSELRLREVQDELAHVTRVTTMGELAASIAHEINQPIAGVVINANTSLRWLSRVKEDSVNLKEARETIERIIRDGVRAGDIIARIRALFKKTELAKEPLDLNEAIQEILVLARNEIDKQKVVLRLELSGELPEVLGDRVQLQQVMLNLILNAVDAMSAVEGRARDLVIGTRQSSDREVVVAVQDSGVGLSPESADAIFAAFHTTKPGGLGMGLPISRSIIENHSGRLWVTGHDGPGATFQFSLPVSFRE